MVFEACDGSTRLIRAQLDMVMLLASDHRALQTAIAARADTAIENIEITYSHTHAGGLFLPDRHELPGGDLIADYLEEERAMVARENEVIRTEMSPFRKT